MSQEPRAAKRVLVVDDEQLFRREVATFLRHQGYLASEAGSGEEALAELQRAEYELVLLDLALPGIGGIEVLQQIARLYPEIVVLIVTAFASVETAIEALRLGAYDYLKKPLRFDDLMVRLQKLEKLHQIVLENQSLKRQLNEREANSEMIGESPAMQRVWEDIRRLQGSLANVLISGESGVGKELVARAVHRMSPAAEKAFLPINVSAIPETMLENQLFGHMRGAFTGAERTQKGVFQAVQGGSVFLDEIGELPLSLQPRLLRAIEQKEVFPIGADAPVAADFRLIAATNRSLEQMAEEGTFRRDLFYRLNVFHIEVPPLRERREDIPLLCQHFVKQFAAALKKPLLGVNREAMQLLIAAPWKGNVRELRNVIERAAILAQGAWIEPNLLPSSMAKASTSSASSAGSTTSLLLRDVLWAREKEHIQAVLLLTEGDKEAAAQMLGLSLATLYRRLEKI